MFSLWMSSSLGSSLPGVSPLGATIISPDVESSFNIGTASGGLRKYINCSTYIFMQDTLIRLHYEIKLPETSLISDILKMYVILIVSGFLSKEVPYP